MQYDFEILKKEEIKGLKEEINLIDHLSEGNKKKYYRLNIEKKERILSVVKEKIFEEINFLTEQPIYKNKKEREWRNLLIKTEGFCLSCGEFIGFRNLTKDHIIPISKGGRDVIENLQPLCCSCNSSKYNKMPPERITKPIIDKVGFRKKRVYYEKK